MSGSAFPPGVPNQSRPMGGQGLAGAGLYPRSKQKSPGFNRISLTAHALDLEDTKHQAELFYLQKQIQAQTPMVIVMEHGEEIHGWIEWYDRYCIKVRGRERSLIYKSTIKYMYKEGENGE
jgi:sRNA-binding regulator protein Hfq